MSTRSNLTKALAVLLGAWLLATMLLYNKESPSLLQKEISHCLLFRLGTTGIEIRYPGEVDDLSSSNQILLRSTKLNKTVLHIYDGQTRAKSPEEIIAGYTKPGPGPRYTNKTYLKGYPAALAEGVYDQNDTGIKFFILPFGDYVINVLHTPPQLKEEIPLAEKMMDDIVIRNNYSNIEKPKVSDCQRWIWER